MKRYSVLYLGLLLVMGLLWGCGPKVRPAKTVLVFSKTKGFRHESIGAGIDAIKQLGKEHGFGVVATEKASVFTEDSLKAFSAVIFLNTTGDVLDFRQQAHFERYIQAGGGFVGVHAATDTEYDWPWFNKLVGAYFNGHPNDPNVREGNMLLVNHNHPSMEVFKGRTEWRRTDEFYNFRSLYHGDSLKDGIVPLINIDEKSYEGGTNGDFHPMSWYHEFDGGRAFYTNFGHTKETYSEPDFLRHLLGGIQYAIGDNRVADYSKARSQVPPDPSRFVVTVLDQVLDEPTEMAIFRSGRVLFVERKGAVKLYEPGAKQSRIIAQLPVTTKHEDGLMGVTLDPKFDENHWVYFYYSPQGEAPINRLSRFTMLGDTAVNLESEKILLEIPVQRAECCHTGGSLKFGPDGNLYLSTGDNTNPFETPYAPINELPGKGPWDAQKSSGSPGDLRGKVLRIRPTPEGGYTIPDGNLFPKDGSKGRPEVYVMGCRNPYRISIDSKTGWLYWGDVGPDGSVDSTYGPRGYDEVNQAQGPGFFGWPYFIGNNYAYRDYDFARKQLGDYFNAAQPVNYSPNNTGDFHELPPATPAFIWYPYGDSKEFPIVGKGGRNAMAGPVFHASDFPAAGSKFPAYYEDKLFVYDFMRDWVLIAAMDAQGKLQSLEPFLPEKLSLSSPIDMEFGPDGALYILEYGTQWFAANRDARLIRVDYAEGNRAPIAQAEADVLIGAAPLTVKFSAAASYDHDTGDQLSYSWNFDGSAAASGEEATFTFQEPGIYQPVLTVRDRDGKSSTAALEIRVGNQPPEVQIRMRGNQSFFWGAGSIPYEVLVSDREDGSLADGGIQPAAVTVSFDYLAEGQDATIGAQGHAANAAAGKIAAGEGLVQTSGCIACHGMDKEIVGPAYLDVSRRYAKQADAVNYLIGKIRNGGQGVWGGKAMPAQAQLTADQAEAMALYILSLADKPAKPGLPVQGQIRTKAGGGLYTLRASYLDRGGPVVGMLRSDAAVTLRSPSVSVGAAETERSKDVMLYDAPNGMKVAIMQKDAHLAFPKLDLTGIPKVTLQYTAPQPGARIELRAGTPDGALIGEAAVPATAGLQDVRSLDIPLTGAAGFQPLYIVVRDPGGAISGDYGVAILLSVYFHAPAAL
ncbi:MAG: ThuA domain-containing protein [Bacteroidia bacterium]|nr:ThuA domain-containing protein [Bacteroidia bacterium]